nr:hypothetical protein [Tanacetum cinerariifolium]
MTSFGYRLNPRYVIKECSSCGTLYTRNCSCLKWNVEDKILVPKPPKNCARCAKCGHLVNGPYCQGCAILREKLEEDLVTYFQNILNTSESSNDSTNVVNAPREPVVVKQDHSVNPPHIDKCCCECGNALNGIFCQQSFCKSCGKDEVIKSSVENLVPIPSESEGILEHVCDVPFHDNSLPLDVSKDQIEDLSYSNEEFYSIYDDSFSNENIEYVEASPHESELVSLEAAEIVIPEVEEIEDDNLREKLLNVHLLIANIEALKDNPTPSSKLLTNGSTTTDSDISLSDYEAFSFNNDHIEEISSGSTTTHSDISLSEYDPFTFDHSNDQFPPIDRSDFANEEFADELAYIISPPEYDCFYFRDLPDPGELISIFNSEIQELSTTCVNLPVEDDHSPLLAYVVWIFLAYLTYPVIPPYLYPFGNEDTIFDPCITINHFCSFKPGLSHRCRAFKKFNTHRSHLNEWPMIINGKNITILDVLLFHFYPP